MLFNISDSPSLLSGLMHMPLKQLRANLGALFGGDRSPGRVDFTHPIFQNITHLAVFDDLSASITDWKTGLSLLRGLTHLSFEAPYPDPLLEFAVAPRLPLWPPGGAWVVSMRTYGINDFINDWQRGACRLDDYWQRAEQTIEEALNGDCQ
ncbi:hypothetical protein B0H11DRAFT_2250329 [Mycena galericulata]|nr:hypothetical protein B0H11DRAFT_2250329 [Mycena galericulata]